MQELRTLREQREGLDDQVERLLWTQQQQAASFGEEDEEDARLLQEVWV